MTQSLKALLALTRDPGFVPRTHTMGQNFIESTLGDPMLFTSLCGHQAHIWHMHIYTQQHTQICKIQILETVMRCHEGSGVEEKAPLVIPGCEPYEL